MDSILYVADVHADAEALSAILRLALSDDFTRRYGHVETFAILGDVVGMGKDPAETVRMIKGLKNARLITGDHDEAFLQGRELPGGDEASALAHQAFRKAGGYEGFYRDRVQFHVDRGAGLYEVHGGPIDPRKIMPSLVDEAEAPLYSRAYQHISGIDVRYFDSAGYHYLPADAFDAVRPIFGGSGHLIVCGHEHREAAYRRRLRQDEDLMPLLKKRSARIDGVMLEEKRLPLDRDADYLIRVGIAGPEGYGSRRSHFGVLSVEDRTRTMYLLNFTR
jgi:Calcineurin-like phosphoesterase